MGKHEPMTAKAIGKRIKSKGLQKLKFYCQMCQKQCRDANGFKCHLTSEAHQRQLLLFGENPNRYLNDFSGEFMKDFLHLLKRRYSTKRVFANQVYQEYIKDRNHLHMNSTRWCTLTGFVQWMGRKGICQVDHTEKGWFITYIDRDPETLLRNEELAKKDKMAKDDDERQAKVIAEMIERGKRAAKKGSDDSGDEEEGEDGDHQKEQEEKRMLKKESEDQKIAFSLAPKKAVEKVAAPLGLLSASGLKSIKPFGSKSASTSSIVKKEEFDGEEATEIEIKPSVLNGLKRNVFDDDFGESKDAVKRSLSKSDDQSASKKQKKKSALDEIIEEQERWKAKRAAQQSSNSSSSSSSSKPSTSSSSWLLPDIVVRVVTKDLGAQYHQKKAVVLKTVGEYGAVIEMLTGDRAKVKVDEAHLETVVPSKAGTAVLVLRGVYRGRKASIVSVDVERERLEVAVENADAGGRTVRLRFDDVSKLA